MSGRAFIWPVRVYWEDTDAGGVVYHARYLHFFERARTEWLRSLGYTQSLMQSRDDMVFAVRRMQIEFIRPARMDDQLEVSAAPRRPGPASLHLRQQMRTIGGEPIATAEVYAACLSAGTFRPRRMPRELRRQIQAACGPENIDKETS